MYAWEIRREVLIAMVSALQAQPDFSQTLALAPYQEPYRAVVSGIAASVAAGDAAAVTPDLFFPDMWEIQAMLQDNDSAASQAGSAWTVGTTGIVVCPPAPVVMACHMIANARHPEPPPFDGSSKVAGICVPWDGEPPGNALRRHEWYIEHALNNPPPAGPG